MIPIHIGTSYRFESGSRYSLILDPEDRDVSDYASLSNAVPMNVWNRLWLQISISPAVVPSCLTAALQSQNVQGLLCQIFDLFQGTKWNGHNLEGCWDQSALQPLEERLQDLLHNIPDFTPADDFVGDLCWSNFMGAQSLDGLASEWVADAAASAIYVDRKDLSSVLREWIVDSLEDLENLEDLDDEDQNNRDMGRRLICTCQEKK